MMRLAAWLVILATIAGTLLFLAETARAAGWPPFDRITEVQEQAERVDELERENARLRRRNRKLQRTVHGYGRWVRSLRRTLRHDQSVAEALNLASVVYGVPRSTLWRRSACESHLHPRARNRKSGALGLFQFLLSTWRSTPFAAFDPYSPYANALAAGWMMGPAGRGGEWECQ